MTEIEIKKDLADFEKEFSTYMAENNKSFRKTKHKALELSNRDVSSNQPTPIEAASKTLNHSSVETTRAYFGLCCNHVDNNNTKAYNIITKVGDEMANLNVRVDDSIKTQADALFAELGMNTTTAVNIFLRKAVQCGGIPFEVRNETPNAETRKAIKNVELGENLSKVFTDTKTLMEDLNA